MIMTTKKQQQIHDIKPNNRETAQDFGVDGVLSRPPGLGVSPSACPSRGEWAKAVISYKVVLLESIALAGSRKRNILLVFE